MTSINAYVKLVLIMEVGECILDKEEFRIKVSRIDNLVAQKKYKEAVEVVESIDWRRVKNVHNLCVVGEIYAANKRYEEVRRFFFWHIIGRLSVKIFCTG